MPACGVINRTGRNGGQQEGDDHCEFQPDSTKMSFVKDTRNQPAEDSSQSNCDHQCANQNQRRCLNDERQTDEESNTHKKLQDRGKGQMPEASACFDFWAIMPLVLRAEHRSA